MDEAPVLLELSGVRKTYPGVTALDGLALALRGGEVHALVGENGAGKSTLAKVLAGLERPDRGEMLLAGEPYAPDGKPAAEERGVRIVMQELNLLPTLSIAENIFLRQLPSCCGIVARGRLHAQARGLMERVGLGGLDPGTLVGDLGIGRQQLVEIAAGVSRQCRLLILDEPTAALTEAERDLLFEQVRRLRAEGVCVVYISHRLEELARIADRVTVLRDGRHVVTGAARDLRLDEIVRHMVGRDVGAAERTAGREPGEAVLRVAGLCRGARVRDVSFELRRGEILGFAGLMGSGRTELLRAVFAADRPDAGAVYLRGSPRPARIRSPRDAVRAGLAFLSEDRKQQGLLLPLAVAANVSLARMEAVARRGRIDARRERTLAERMAGALAIRCRSTAEPVRQLSGGNQQKVVLARWLARESDVLLFDEPTRGIDVGARFEIYRLLFDLADQGKAIAMASSDLLELLAVADRIAVLSAGRLVRIFERPAWSQDAILAAALSGYADRATAGTG